MPTTYNRNQLADVFKAYGVNPSTLFLLDSEYVYLDHASAPAFFSAISSQVINILKGWKKEFCDCDKFSRVVQAIAQVAHATQWAEQNTTPAGLAVAVFNYMKPGEGGHSINCIVTKEDGLDKFHIRFFEPQTAREVLLSPKEANSAFMVLL
jgi:hypothetical protein